MAEEVELPARLLPREGIAAESIARNGKIILVKSLEEAVEISNLIAPEHLEICTENPFALMDGVKHAGSVFLGQYCPEALGDYLAGPNHTLPTRGYSTAFPVQFQWMISLRKRNFCIIPVKPWRKYSRR